MNIRYRVELNEGERAQLTAMLSGGKHAARKLKRAQILLAADAGIGDEAIADSISVGGSTVYRTKRRFVEGNLDLALSEEARPGSYPARRRRCWWRRFARAHPKVVSAGRSICWPVRWSN
jgi:Homeodomain-like domain